MTDEFVVRPHRRLFDPETRITTHAEGRVFSSRAEIPPAQEDRVVVYPAGEETPVPAPGGLAPFGSQDDYPAVSENPSPWDDANSFGWTNFSASVDTRIVYVAANGSDSNNGLFPENLGGGNGPKLTLRGTNGGISLIRNTFPDWLLLRKGDHFNDSFGNWSKSGRSATERILISSYGLGPRPVVDPGTGNGMNIFSAVSSFAMVGIEMYPVGHVTAGGYDAHGIQLITTGCSNILVEDCYFHNFGGTLGNNITMSDNSGANGISNVVIRRNVIADAWNGNVGNGTGANGIYWYGINGGLIEENVIVNNGASAAHPGSQWPGHNMYLGQSVDNTTVVRGNIVALTDGCSQRSGGKNMNNFYLKGAQGCSIASTIASGPGYVINVRGNVALDGADIPIGSGGGGPYGKAFFLENVSGGEFCYNIAANNVTATGPNPFRMRDQNSPVKVEHCDVHHNLFYKWGGTCITIEGSPSHPPAGNKLRNNDVIATDANETLIQHDQSSTYSTNYFDSGQVANNRFYRATSQATAFATGSGNVSVSTYQTNFSSTGNTMALPTYPAPTRSASTWFTSLGVCHGITPDGNLDTYLAACKLQSRDDWVQELMPTYGQPDLLVGSFANYLAAGNLQSVEWGPIRYIRNGFTDTTNKLEAMGTTITSPLSAITGSKDGGTAITITGTNFVRSGSNTTDQTAITKVLFNGQEAGDVIVVSTTSITCTSPASNLPSPYTGIVDVKVETGEGIATLANAFTYT